MEWGYALPETGSGNAEYIGYIVSFASGLAKTSPDKQQKGSSPSGQGWSGISHAGGMPNALLLVASPDGSNVKTQFVWAG